MATQRRNNKNTGSTGKWTHFLALPAEAVQGAIGGIQGELLRYDPKLGSFIKESPMKRAHISVIMLYLPTERMEKSKI